MKRTIFFSLLTSVFLISCEKTPVAQFHTDTVEPEVGHNVMFTNDSQNATKFEWDFGDGFISNEANPGHVFNVTGPFVVTLTAISKSGLEDKATLSLKVMVPTLLNIEVLDYWTESPVADASVYLYTLMTDWDVHNDKRIAEGFTDSNGVIVFANLDPKEYFVDVWSASYDNYTLRNELNGVDLYIRTPVILQHQINKFTAWVDYYGAKGSDDKRGTRSLIIKKFERKVSEKDLPVQQGGTQGWEELYNRRVVQK